MTEPKAKTARNHRTALLSTLFRPAAAAYATRRPAAKAHLLGLGHLLRQTGLFAARGILVQNALGGGFIDSGGGEAVLRRSVGGGSGDLRLKLLDGGLDLRLHHTVPKVLGFADLHALDSGLDVRQRGSPPWVLKSQG